MIFAIITVRPNDTVKIVTKIRRITEPSLAQKVLIILILPVACQVVFFAVLTNLLTEAEREIWRENHSKAVISVANEVNKSFYDAGTALLAYSYTRSTPMLERYKSLSQTIP